jgi:hypothetical protein
MYFSSCLASRFDATKLPLGWNCPSATTPDFSRNRSGTSGALHRTTLDHPAKPHRASEREAVAAHVGGRIEERGLVLERRQREQPRYHDSSQR